MKRKRLMRVLPVFVCAAIWILPLAAQNDQASSLLEGSWFGWAAIEGFPQTVPFVDLYSADSNSSGRSGAVLCTLLTGAIPGPDGSLLSGTASAHGSWARVDKNQFAFTAWKILANEGGQPVGAAKFWGSVTAKSSDTLTGVVFAAFYYGGSATPFMTLKGTTTSRRIEPVLEVSK